MPGKPIIGMVAAALIGAAVQVFTPAPAHAQASCMHCRFEVAQCKRIGTLSPAKCEEQRVACVKKCKAMAAGSTDASEKSKSADKRPKKK